MFTVPNLNWHGAGYASSTVPSRSIRSAFEALFLLPRSPRWPDTKDRRLHVGRLSVRSGIFRHLCVLCASVARGFTGRDSHGVSAFFDPTEAVLAGASAVLLAHLPTRSRPPIFVEQGQWDSNPRAHYRHWFSRPAHSSALPCPSVNRPRGHYTIFVPSNHHRVRRGLRSCPPLPSSIRPPGGETHRIPNAPSKI